MTSFICRSCGSVHGRTVLDLGIQPLANSLLPDLSAARSERRFPLRVALCEACWLLQITDIIPPEDLFSEYLYFSSFSDALLRHSAAAVRNHIERFGLGSASFVVEVASNDGYLLRNFKSAGVPCLGVEPAANIAAKARENGIDTVCKFFSSRTAAELLRSHGPADLIIGNNVFAHVPETNDFVAGLDTLLKPKGRVALEFPYACDMIEHVEFDTIYHEHVFYFTLMALLPLFARHGLEIVDVERHAIHGGSLRLFAAKKGAHAVQPSVAALLAEEKARGVDTVEFYSSFGDRVEGIRQDLTRLLQQLKTERKSVAAYGASAKGSTLLNFCGLGAETLDFVADRSTAKVGRFTPGSHLPIVSSAELAQRRPDYALLLTWNFAEEIFRQQEAYRQQGGKFIVPIPKVTVA